MVGRDHLVEIKRIEELDLTILPPTHHAPLPPMTASNQRITVCEPPQRKFCNKISPKADIRRLGRHHGKIAEIFLRWRRLALKQRLDFLEQPFEFDRLGVVIVASGFQRLFAVAGHGVRSQPDDWQMLGRPARP